MKVSLTGQNALHSKTVQYVARCLPGYLLYGMKMHTFQKYIVTYMSVQHSIID